jgi:signal transduction histidine kinase
VRLRCVHEAALVRIEVLDTGIGTAADQLPFICDEFYQIDDTSSPCHCACQLESGSN